MPSLQDYLSSKYGSGSSKKPKRASKQHNALPKQSEIETDDPIVPESVEEGQLSSDDDVPQEAEAKKQSGWKKVGGSEASKVRVEAVKTTVLRSDTTDNDDGQLMSSGARAGLQTAQQVQKSVDEKQRAELERLKVSQTSGRDAETVHRDSSGRIIDIGEHRRAEQQQKEQEQREREKRHREINQGLVQRLEQDKKKREEQNAAGSSINVHKDNKQLNDMLREREREHDPAARFVSKKRKAAPAVSATGLPVYTGAYASNRFNIAPGCKWDGVDRSNGFEKLWFEKQTERREKKTLAYTMALDD
jgi:pre-mRNA-splicing factor CWC26